MSTLAGGGTMDALLDVPRQCKFHHSRALHVEDQHMIPLIPLLRDHYVSMDVKVGDTSYSGYGHGSRVSGVNTRCVDHGTNKPSEWVSLKRTTK